MVAYYNGKDSLNVKHCDYAINNGLRDVIIRKQQAVMKIHGNKQIALVLIKPTSKSIYKNTVDALDEMKICNVKSYTIQTASAFEEAIQ